MSQTSSESVNTVNEFLIVSCLHLYIEDINKCIHLKPMVILGEQAILIPCK